MWAIIQKSETGLPTMVNQSSEHFCDFIQSGYEIIQQGTKRECEAIWDEMVQEFASLLD